jgi:hypothetical protein
MCFNLKQTEILVFTESNMVMFFKFFEHVLAKSRGLQKPRYGYRQDYECRMRNLKHGYQPVQGPRKRKTTSYVEGTCKVRVSH